jgi:hypothetical protein
MASDVFISHSVKDKRVADLVVAKLEAESVRCWVAPRDVVPGADWGESIIDAIESSRIMILIFSRSANESPQIKREVERAVDKGVYTIPFRVDDIEPTRSLEYFISASQWMDAFAPPLERHLDNLTKTVKAVLAVPPLPKPVGMDAPTNPVELIDPVANGSTAHPFSRSQMAIIATIPALLIVGAAGWYLGHKREVPPEKSTEPTQVEKQVAVAKLAEDEANKKPSEPIATEPPHEVANVPMVLPGKDATRVAEPRREADTKYGDNQDTGLKGGLGANNSATVAEPSIAPARGPWLFPDSSSRYLSATELSTLSSADLWRARNEIYARNGYKFSTASGIDLAKRLGHYYRGVDDDQDRVFNNMNQYEQANVTLIKSIEGGQ